MPNHTEEVCLGTPFFDAWGDESQKAGTHVPDWWNKLLNGRTIVKENDEIKLILPGEDYVPFFPTGTTLHGRPQQGLDGELGIEPEIYGDGEVYL